MMAAPLFPDTPADEAVRAAVLSEARTWIGTPYRHQSSCFQAGCDCLGLLRGIWRGLYGPEPEDAPDYSADWAETSGQETLLDAGRRWLQEIPLGAARPGDAVLFRWREDCPAKHAAILSPPEAGVRQIIHAYERVGVIESPLVPAWRRRMAAAFSFPEIKN